MTKDPKLSVCRDEPAGLHRSDAVHGLTSRHAGRKTEDPRRARCRQERFQGARHPRAPRLGARAGQRVGHRARNRIQREHGVSPAADAGPRAATSSRTRASRLRDGSAPVPARERLSQGQRSRGDRAAASRGAARRRRRDDLPRDPEPGRDRAAVQGRRPARGQRIDAHCAARAGVLHRDRQGAAVGPRGRCAGALPRDGGACRPTRRRRSRARRSCSASSRRAHGGLRARRRGVRREPVLHQRAGTRSEQRDDRGGDQPRDAEDPVPSQPRSALARRCSRNGPR